MQTIKVTTIVNKQKGEASFKVDNHEIASIKQNTSLPNGYFQGKVRGFGNLFDYMDDFEEAVENVSHFLSNTFEHNFGIKIELTQA